MSQILDGRQISKALKQSIADEIRDWTVKPGLAVVRVGNDPASELYVNSKEKACAEVGFYSRKIVLPEDSTQSTLLAVIDELNQDAKIHGILVQLPVPQQIDEQTVLNAIDSRKDVDGFHPMNSGALLNHRRGMPEGILSPCTPRGCLKLIEHTGIPIKGKHAVIIGRSNLVGKPVALLLLYADATVTICHRETKNLKEVCLQADILVAAAGKAHMVTADMVKPGAIVLDVGVSKVDGKTVGDVDFDNVKNVASWITPMPGGTGPMTIACLLENTLIAMKNQN